MGEDTMNVRDFVKRNKVLINIVIGSLGVILVLLALFPFGGNQEIRDILFNIGVSFFSTAIVAIILIFSLPEESNEAAELLENGLRRIYKDGKVVRFSENDLPEKYLDIISLNIQWDWMKDDFKDDIADKIKRGLKVRILTMHPDSAFIPSKVQRENGKRDENIISLDIMRIKVWYDDICKRIDTQSKGSISIKFYDNLPLLNYCRADNNIWCGLDQLLANYEDKMVYEYRVGSNYGKEYIKLFERCWKGNDGFNIVEYNRTRFHGDQRKSIETVLQYFCDVFGTKCQHTVKGVVVLFKDVKRKTIFSCNKANEMYKCHHKNSGVVGELVKKQAEKRYSQAQITVFADFSEQLSFIHCKGQRLPPVPEKKKYSNQSCNDDDTTHAVLATGLYVDNELIGAVTFDFFDFPDKYQQELKLLKDYEDGVELAEDVLLKTWFEMAFACSEMISNMVGHYVICDFQNLFDNTWEECQ